MRRSVVIAAFALAASPVTAAADTIIDGGNVINQIWTPAGSPYRLRGDVTVPLGAFLFIEAGTTIVVEPGDRQGSGIDPTLTELRNHGVLRAEGSAAAPVVMRGNGRQGAWYGVVSSVGDVSTRLHHVQIEDTIVGVTSGSSGQGLHVAHTSVTRTRTGFQIEVGNPHLEDITATGDGVGGDGSYGLRALWGSAPSASRVTLVGFQWGVGTWDSSLTIDNCVLRGNARGVEFAAHAGRSLAVSHCTITGGVHHGVLVYGDFHGPRGGTATIDSSIIVNNTVGVELSHETYATLTVRHTDVWGNGTNYLRATPGVGCISANPQFISSTDLRLQPSSVCIDTCPDGAPVDRSGAARPVDGDGLGDALWDMGAYEHAAVSRRCGDGVVGPGETCDDGDHNGEYGRCNDTCTGPAGRCGDGVVNGPEQCDDGNAASSDACLATCRLATCGDGFVWDGAEGCDDGNRVDTDACTGACRPAVCGDGITWAGEETCDDGNRSNTDACLTTCEAARCGDGVTWAGHEACDDGNPSNTDACTSACVAARCGDGITWAGEETCDDGNSVDGDACLSTCQAATCGDGVVWAGVEQCDDGNRVGTDGCTSACTSARCGDGVVHDGVEECDDANGVSTDACVAGCRAATCGDGFVRAGVEACDDGNDSNTDGCTSGCAAPTCGDGFVQAGEQCDDANRDDGDACLHTCVAASCGDGFVHRDREECDDGNRDDDDGCSATCVVETPDAGIPDAALPDAGAPDATGPDASLPDASLPDAGVAPDAADVPDAPLPEPCDTDAATGAPDATTQPDAVDDGGGGDGCQTGRGSLPGAALLVLGALFAVRRRRP